ncbi:hypothetical protein HPSA20_0389 [Helicobacter pylori SouthAfrica20]|uniref:Uncharacterized protein n=1 Tax=Helicobacter pylori SouthAfrica20 TaxID=1352356 RepID=T1U8S2_HELPX|nr:hypothetical protein HPSA20_0389 [Helicobacter pylori SouthAfrica20]
MWYSVSKRPDFNGSCILSLFVVESVPLRRYSWCRLYNR